MNDASESGSASIPSSARGLLTLRQALLAALVVVATMVCASAILWDYWDLAVR